MTAPTIRDGTIKKGRRKTVCYVCKVDITFQVGYSSFCVQCQEINRATADHRLGFFCGTCRTHFTRESGLRSHQGNWREDERPVCPLREENASAQDHLRVPQVNGERLTGQSGYMGMGPLSDELTDDLRDAKI